MHDIREIAFRTRHFGGHRRAYVSAFAESATRDLKIEEANRKLVVEFYDRFFNKHDIAAASVVADDYRQHNPQVPDGKKPLISFFA